MSNKNTNMQIYKGLITAIITPQKDGKIDFDAFKMLVARQIEAEVNGIVVAGSTGEGNCLTTAETDSLLAAACEACHGHDIKIIAGVATASTAEALERVRLAQQHEIHGLMLTVPYYVKPSQAGIIKHFQMLHDNSTLPILIYDNPGRTGIGLTDETIIALGNMERVTGFKDAHDDMLRPTRISAHFKDADGVFDLLSGNDDNILSYLGSGGVGLVSVVGNIMPKSMKKLCDLIVSGKREEAIALQQSMIPIYQAIFSVSNPIGVKAASAHLGHCSNECRLPLMPPAAREDDLIKSIVPLINKIENMV